MHSIIMSQATIGTNKWPEVPNGSLRFQETTAGYHRHLPHTSASYRIYGMKSDSGARKVLSPQLLVGSLKLSAELQSPYD